MNDRAFRRPASALLARNGHAFTKASSFGAAMETIPRQAVDIVLLDYQLGD
ncbi:MAG: response regulator [Planctomycetota bacterium]